MLIAHKDTLIVDGTEAESLTEFGCIAGYLIESGFSAEMLNALVAKVDSEMKSGNLPKPVHFREGGKEND